MDNKPSLNHQATSFDFDKVQGRKSDHKMYSELDGTYQSLFPEFSSSHQKIHRNISFDKVPGRQEHGHNLHARKVQRQGASIILRSISEADMISSKL